MVTQAKKKANRRYERQSVNRVSVAFFPKDKELYSFLCQFNSKSEYIRELIRKDMEEYKAHHEA